MNRYTIMAIVLIAVLLTGTPGLTALATQPRQVTSPPEGSITAPLLFPEDSSEFPTPAKPATKTNITAESSARVDWIQGTRTSFESGIPAEWDTYGPVTWDPETTSPWTRQSGGKSVKFDFSANGLLESPQFRMTETTSGGYGVCRVFWDPSGQDYLVVGFWSYATNDWDSVVILWGDQPTGFYNIFVPLPSTSTGKVDFSIFHVIENGTSVAWAYDVAVNLTRNVTEEESYLSFTTAPAGAQTGTIWNLTGPDQYCRLISDGGGDYTIPVGTGAKAATMAGCVFGPGVALENPWPTAAMDTPTGVDPGGCWVDDPPWAPQQFHPTHWLYLPLITSGTGSLPPTADIYTINPQWAFPGWQKMPAQWQYDLRYGVGQTPWDNGGIVQTCHGGLVPASSSATSELATWIHVIDSPKRHWSLQTTLPPGTVLFSPDGTTSKVIDECALVTIEYVVELISVKVTPWGLAFCLKPVKEEVANCMSPCWWTWEGQRLKNYLMEYAYSSAYEQLQQGTKQFSLQPVTANEVVIISWVAVATGVTFILIADGLPGDEVLWLVFVAATSGGKTEGEIELPYYRDMGHRVQTR